MRRRQEEGMADAPHTNPNPNSHIEYVSFTCYQNQHVSALKLLLITFIQFILLLLLFKENSISNYKSI